MEFDALHTIMINSFIPTYVCFFFTAQGIALWALFVLMYIFVLYYTMNVQYCGNCNVNCSCVTSNLIGIVILFAFGLFLLANNIYCYPFIIIIMKNLVLIVVITAIVLLLVYRCLSKTQQEKLLPRALYQHLHPQPDELPYVNEN